MDDQQSVLIDKYQKAILEKKEDNHSDHDGESESDNDLFAELENDDSIISRYRDERMEQLKSNIKKIDWAVAERKDEVGKLQFLEDEKQVMDQVLKSEVAIVHFYQPQFQKCKVMNERLTELAERHLTLNIMSIKAEDAAFLTHKLDIKILPFVVIYKKGKEATRIVGFEHLSKDPLSFSLDSLEQFLFLSSVIDRKTSNIASIRSKSSAKPSNEDDDSDLDL